VERAVSPRETGSFIPQNCLFRKAEQALSQRRSNPLIIKKNKPNELFLPF